MGGSVGGLFGRLFTGLPDNGEEDTTFYCLAFRDINLQQNAAGGRGDLGIHFVSANFQQRLKFRHRITDPLQPLADCPLDHAFA
jgi:hypothetical protein